MAQTPILASQGAFKVTIDSITDENEYFYAVDGLSITYNITMYTPGGEVNAVPMVVSTETQPLVFKRPLINIVSGMSKWCSEALESKSFKPVNVNVFVMGLNRDTINNHWIAENAYPIGMQLSSIDIYGSESTVMEILTLTYTNLKRIK